MYERRVELDCSFSVVKHRAASLGVDSSGAACNTIERAPVTFYLSPPFVPALPNAPTRLSSSGVCWKAARVGERLSPYVSVALLLMAGHVLFFAE